MLQKIINCGAVEKKGLPLSVYTCVKNLAAVDVEFHRSY